MRPWWRRGRGGEGVLTIGADARRSRRPTRAAPRVHPRGTLAGAVARARELAAEGDTVLLAGLRVVRSVPELRGPRRAVQAARARPLSSISPGPLHEGILPRCPLRPGAPGRRVPPHRARAGDGLLGQRRARAGQAATASTSSSASWWRRDGPGGDGGGDEGGLAAARALRLPAAHAHLRAAGAGAHPGRGHDGGRGAAVDPPAGLRPAARGGGQVLVGGLPGLLAREEAREGGDLLGGLPAAPAAVRRAGAAVHEAAGLRQLRAAGVPALRAALRRRHQAELPGGQRAAGPAARVLRGGDAAPTA